jgi:serine/threonine-protein kinase
LFSLGVMLYELLSGARPFEGPNDRSTSLRIRQNAAPPLTQGGVKVSGSVERLVARCLEKLPSDRMGSAAELAAELRQALTEVWSSPAEQAILGALTSTGLTEGKSLPPKQPPRVVQRGSLGSAALGLAIIGFAIVTSGYGLRRAFGSSEATRRGAAPVSTPGAEAGELRVVAHPWAHVFVDGQERETTPFARPIRLSPGTHYVRLEHPAAPPERRTVSLTPGEAVMLEVDMKVAATADSALLPAPSSSSESESP